METLAFRFTLGPVLILPTLLLSATLFYGFLYYLCRWPGIIVDPINMTPDELLHCRNFPGNFAKWAYPFVIIAWLFGMLLYGLVGSGESQPPRAELSHPQPTMTQPESLTDRDRRLDEKAKSLQREGQSDLEEFRKSILNKEDK